MMVEKLPKTAKQLHHEAQAKEALKRLRIGKYRQMGKLISR